MPDVAAGHVAIAGPTALLKPKRDIARHRLAQTMRAGVGRALVVLALAVVFLAAAFYGAFRMVSYFRDAEEIGHLLAAKVLAMLLLAFGSLLLLSNVIGALSGFFLARDLDQIAASPVPPRALYRARLLETATHASWMVALLLLPVVAAYGAAYGGGVRFALVAVGTLLPFLAVPAAAGALATLALVNIFPARRTRDLLSVVSALAIAGLVLLFRAARPEQLARPEGFAHFMDFIAALDTPSAPWMPTEWAAQALMAAARGRDVLTPLAALWAAAFALLAVGEWAYARGWARAFSLAQEGATSRRGTGGARPWLDRLFASLGPVRRELVLKELRVFARDSTQWSQLVLLMVLLVVYVANVRYLPLNGGGMTTLLRNVIPFLNLALAGFVLASIAARFVFPGVSLEGRALWLLRSSPLSMRTLLLAKYLVGVVPLLVLALILVGLTNVLLGVRPFVHVVSLAAITGLVFPLAAMALAFGAVYPRFDTENAAQIPTSFGGLLYMMSAVVLIGAVAWLTGRPAARFVVAEHFGWTRDPMAMVVPFVGAAVLCVAGTLVPLRIAHRALDALERG